MERDIKHARQKGVQDIAHIVHSGESFFYNIPALIFYYLIVSKEVPVIDNKSIYREIYYAPKDVVPTNAGIAFLCVDSLWGDSSNNSVVELLDRLDYNTKLLLK